MWVSQKPNRNGEKNMREKGNGDFLIWFAMTKVTTRTIINVSENIQQDLERCV